MVDPVLLSSHPYPMKGPCSTALSWRAQKCAVSQELGRNLFYKPSMQVYRCIEGSDRVIVELSRQFFQNRLDLRVLVQGRLTHHGREQIAREEAAIVPQNDQVRLGNPPVSRKDDRNIKPLPKSGVNCSGLHRGDTTNCKLESVGLLE